MKRIFTHLFVAVLLMLSSTSWAQSETMTFTVSPSNGEYGSSSSVNYASAWTSTTTDYPTTTISVGANNMYRNAADGCFEIASGQSKSSTWSLTVSGYVITSYSFNYKLKDSSGSITITPDGGSAHTVTDTEQTLTVENVDSETATFLLAGDNKHVVVTNLQITIAKTELEEGKVYRFVNRNTKRSLNACSESSVNAATTDAANLEQQWYVTKEGDYFVLRNLYYAKYLKGAHVNKEAWSLTDDYSLTANNFTFAESDKYYSTLETKGWTSYGFMHDDGNGYNGGTRVSSWDNENSTLSSHWMVYEVEYTADELQAILDERPTAAEAVAKVSENFISLFNETACYTPKYSSLAEAQATAAYRALTDEMQQLVNKIYNKTYGDGWAEANADNSKEGWDAKYAKKFRVQMYEPYSIAGDITSWLGLNSHANNDNPTGIYMPAAGNLYVMVEGEIKEGATLRIVDGYTNRRINGTTTESAVVLKQGLNVINYTGATGMLYICYNVDTYNPNGATHAEKFPRKLSEFAPLKIHIEGGAINGFYNACGDFRATTDAENLWKTYTGASVDADADWEYMETRANLSILPILGHREILLLQLEDEQGGPGLRSLLPEAINCPSTPYSYAESWADYGMGCDPSTGKINIVMEAWDRIMYSQLATMGLVSNSQMERMNDLYPRWTKEGTRAEMYDYENKSNIDNKTYLEFCQGIDYSEYFNHHGIILGTSSGNPYGSGDHVGYPIGGFADAVYDLPNTAGSTWGPAHEIGHQHQGLLTLNGLTEVTNNLFSNISLWYKGMSTSRYNGSDGSLESVLNAFNTNGSDIYTNNIWALTHLYYRLWLYYHLAGNNTQFYPRLFELLRNEQMQKGYNVSGDVSTLHFYKLTCQAAGEDLTEFFRAHGYFSVMEDRFVGDYSNSVYNVSQAMIDAAIAEVKAMNYPENLSIIFINDDDDTATYLQHDGENAREIYGETKPNSDFGSVTDFIAGNVAKTPYTATLNSDGTLTMSGGEGGVGFLIVNEKGEIVSFSNKSTFALGDEAMEAIISGNATIKSVGSASNVLDAEVDLTILQKDVLGAMMSKAQSIVDKVDDTYTKIGYFKKAAVADLENALEYAEEVYAGSSGYEAAYDLLYAEYAKVLENKDAKIPFNPSLTYIIKNKAYSSETMWVNGSGVVRSEGGVDQTSNDARWKFVETSTAGVYNICTLNNKYIPAVQQSASMTATTGQADSDALYTLEEVADGVWAIKLSPAAGYRNLHSSWSNVVGWETGVDASRWYLTAVAADPVIADLTDLEVYINKTEQLLDEVLGAVTYTKGTPLSLQTTTQGSAGYLWSNAPETREGNIANLVDGASNNYFHTDWSSEPPSGSHYLAVYLGEENTLERFTFSHTTRSGASSDFPKSVDVYGSNDGTTYKFIGSASGMPQSAGTAWEFNGVMQSSYKYLRFNYHANRGYWHMAEFDITPITGFTATVNDTYRSTVEVDEITAAMNALLDGKRIANGISPTTGDVAAKLSALQTAYNALYTQYEATINARKATLAQLAAETETLINSAGAVTLAKETPITLTTSNFYCNAPYIASQNADYSAEYVSKLTDKNPGTYLHTRWNTNSDDGDYHYLRVDAGETTPIDLFYFTYTTASRGKKDMPLTMVVEGANEIDASNSTKDTFTEIATLTSLPEVLNTNTVYESSVLGSAGTKYRYLRFKVTDITADEDDKNGHPFFTMSEFGLTSVTEENVAVNNVYKSFVTDELLLTTVHTTNSSKSMSANALVTSVPLLDAQIADQTAAKAALEEAMAKMAVDKDALQSLYDDALALYNEMADGDGNVNDNYRPSDLTNDMLAEAKTVLDVAKTALDSSNSQSEIDDAKTALQAQYDALLEIKNANVATTIDKSGLNTAIANANTLIAAIKAKGDGYYESVAGFGLAELSTALQNAQDVVGRFYLTEEQYNETLTQLNTCYTTTNGIIALDCNSENRNNLSTLIGNVNALLTVIADAGETTVALPLQSTKADAAFYIWCNDPASDSQGVAGLIDKNADGTANTGTFLGSDWGSDVPAYTHYIEVDLGVAGTIDQLTMDYTTRNSTHADQRPNAIKILGSNDKANYNEITEITSGLAANANEKWSMGELLDLGGRYRYIRVAVGSQRGFFHMADFNLYTKLSHTLKEYYTTAEGLDLTTLCLVLDEAKDAAAHYMTTEQYTAVYNKLNGCYTTADGIVDNDYSDRDALATLKNDADALVDAVVAIDETETVLALQATDATAPYYIYCNAPGATNNYAGDNLGVAALLDADDNGEPITATFLHTSYVAGSHDDALDHYLRVDMGESNLLSFKFRYTPRIGNTGNAPLVMLIEGSNDCVNFEEITTLSDMATTYQSGEITNGKAYRYIRFMVKETHNHSKFDNHEFFAMSHFEMTACKTVTISQEYASPNLSVDVAANAYNELVDAAVFDANYYLASETGAEIKGELQAAYDALNAAIALQNIPVKLTTDVNNPVLYKIKVKSNGKVFTYDGQTADASKNPVLAVDDLGNEYQAWYFMQGNNEDSNDDILILPYYHEGTLNTTHKLGYPNINASTKPVVSESGASSYNWYITFTEDKTTEGWWNLQPQDGTSDNTFVNQQGGSSSTILSFWKNSNNPSDPGSQFQFVLDETDYSLSDAYYALLAQYEASVAEVAYGTKIGTYSEVSVTAYKSAYNNAAALLEAKNSTDTEYDEARATLLEKYNAIEYNRGLCRIRSAYTGDDGYSTGKLIYVGAENKLYFEKAEDEDLSKYVWEFVPVKGGYNIKSLHTQSNVVSATTWGGQVALSDEGDPKLVTIDFLAEDIVRLNVSGGHPLHAQQQGSTIVHYAGDLESASAWYLEEIAGDAKEDIKHTVSLGANESGSDTNAYSTLYLAYNAQIPDGVTASIVEDVNELGQLVMTPVEGGILPANTAVVLSCETTDAQNVAAEFLYTDEESAFDTTGNMLQGTSYNKLVHCGDTYNVYMLGKKSGRVAFYWTYENRGADGNYVYINANEEIVESTAAGAHKNHNKGGYVKCNANKAYLLDEENPAQAAAAMYSFFFGGNTTDLDEVEGENEEVKTIYDLQGRKLVKITSPGIYIVDGKKVYVTEIEE